MPENRLEMAHLQLTRLCNLRCRFCGQWGVRGFFRRCDSAGLTLKEWKSVVDTLARHGDAVDHRPLVMLWGGEPLLYPDFDAAVGYLRNHGFELGVITNGTLLDKYSDLVKNEFATVYVSIDGDRKIHDSIRGQGVFEKAIGNIGKLKNGKAKIIFMATLCPENIASLPRLPYLFKDCGADKILFHDLICLDSPEVAEYKSWLLDRFGTVANQIDSWRMNLPPGYESLKRTKLDEMFRNLAEHPIGTPVEYLPHGVSTNERHCLAPFRRLHVAWDGSVLFCTDFNDFSAGNIRRDDLIAIWHGESAVRFRREVMSGNCPICKHCSWKSNLNYSFD